MQDSFNYGVEWVYPSTQEINPPVMPARSSLSIDSKKVCTSFFQNTITLLDAEQGKILWQYEFPEITDIIHLGIHPNGDIYAMDLAGLRVCVIDQNGKFKHDIPFSFNANWIRTVPSFIFTNEGLTYYGTTDGIIYCVNEKGEIIWTRLIGESEDSDIITPVTGLTLTKDEKLLVGVSSFNRIHNPVYGIDSSTGEIMWKYQHPKYKAISYITADSADNILLPASNPEELSRWFSADPNSGPPPFDKLSSTYGGAVILLDLKGIEQKIVTVPNQISIYYVKPCEDSKKLYILGETYLKSDKLIFSTDVLFVTDYNSNIFWDTASPPLSVRGNVAQKSSVFLDGENIFVGSIEGIYQFNSTGEIIRTYDLESGGSALIIGGNPDKKTLYIQHRGGEYGKYKRVHRIYKIKYYGYDQEKE